MKFISLVLAIGLFTEVVQAQTDSLQTVKEINEQVWKPFVNYISSGNHNGLSTLHSKRITRVLIDTGTIMDYNKYFPSDAKPAENYKEEGVTRTFELRFDKRISNGTKAWESGFYKGSSIKDGKEIRAYYGRFFVVLEKENGIWKIVVDADTGKDANAENFNKAHPIH